MVRPRKPRRVAFLPGVTYFKPRGIPLRLLEEVQLSLEELEAIRLKDLEELEQEDAASLMGVSRPTFQRILEQARHKVAEALVQGKALRIEGGDYQVVPMQLRCRHCGHRWEQVATSETSFGCPNCEEKPSDTAPRRGRFHRGRPCSPDQ